MKNKNYQTTGVKYYLPVSTVEKAYEKLKRVWKDNDSVSGLEIKIWNKGHVFDQKMQDAAFIRLYAISGKK